MLDQEKLNELLDLLKARTGRPDPIGINRYNTAGPSIFYVSRDDRLLLRVKALGGGPQMRINVRFLSPEGLVQPQVYAFNFGGQSSSFQNAFFDLAEGYILSVFLENIIAALGDGTSNWAELYIVRGNATSNQRVQLLTAGYVNLSGGLAWPPVRAAGPRDTGPNIASSNVADPAAGVELSFSPGGGIRGNVLTFRFSLVTDATVATRRVHVVIDDGTNIFADLAAADTQAASLTRNYNCEPDGFARAAQDSEIYIPLFQPLEMFGTYRIRTVTTNLQAGDNFSAGRVLQQTWQEP